MPCRYPAQVNAPATRPWRLRSPDPVVVAGLQRELGRTEFECKLIASRGFVSGEQPARRLERDLKVGLRPPREFRGMAEATFRLAQAIRAGEMILIHGDYDVDGVTGTVLLVRVLRQLGARVAWHIPHRQKDGYSFGEHSIDKAREVQASLVISVDNGTAAGKVITALRELGIDTIVTDHHEPPEGPLPPAVALLNPKLPDSTCGFRELCGAGVAFKLAWGLCEHLHGKDLPEDLRAVLRESTSLVAIATVADVVPLLDENRCLAWHGLKTLAETKDVGTRALLSAARLADKKSLSAGDIGFGVGPLINAAGRLDSADLAVKLLLETDPLRAKEFAQELADLNARRKQQSEALLCEVERAAKPFEDPLEWPFLVLAGEGWHQGLIGIAAGRMVERMGRPALVIGLDQGLGKGSARTVNGIDLLPLLAAATPHFLRFGGHAQAAGCEIRAERVDAARAALNDAAREGGVLDKLGPPELWIDGEIDPAAVDESLMHLLGSLEPFGQGFEEPRFLLRGLRLISGGSTKDGKHLRLSLRKGSTDLEAMAFFQGSRQGDLVAGRDIHCVVQVGWNEFRGRKTIQFRVLDFAVGDCPPLRRSALTLA